jgi:N-acylneuraminate cytidylyltransferase
MKTLYLIPARAGSKGIHKKNTRVIGGKPLVIHSLMLARRFASDDDICISTDDDNVIEVASKEGYHVQFKRPDHLADDTSGMHEVMIHALKFYKSKGINYDQLVLLQPTSPFRLPGHLQGALDLFSPELEMVVSVTESKANPYFVLFEEDNNGLLRKSKEGSFATRQEIPKVWQLNGAIYVINVNSLLERRINQFSKIKKFVMDQLHSIDLDTEIDWNLAMLINEQNHIIPVQ